MDRVRVYSYGNHGYTVEEQEILATLVLQSLLFHKDLHKSTFVTHHKERNPLGEHIMASLKSAKHVREATHMA